MSIRKEDMADLDKYSNPLRQEVDVTIKKILDTSDLALQTEVVPTDTSKNNPSTVLTWTGDKLTQVDMTIGAVVYRQTLTWTGENLTAISAWSVV